MQPTRPESSRKGVCLTRRVLRSCRSSRQRSISFFFLSTASWTMFPVLTQFLDMEDGLGPLMLPTFGSVLVEALIGTAVLTIISLTIVLVERHRKVPGWLPFVASFPVAWGLALPSALELGGSLLAWLAFGAMVAGIFCLHWRVFTWAPDDLGIDRQDRSGDRK